MPAIKLKKAAAEHQAEKEREEREREAEVPSVKAKDINPGASLLKGLDANILLEKRKRPVHPSEQKLSEWLESNLEKKENSHASWLGLYTFFGEACSFDGTAVVDEQLFRQRIREKFGKGYALKESSPYKGLINEKSSQDKPKQKTESTKLKMKEIIEEAIKEAGNPEKGVRFGALKQYIACNYPILRVDLRPAYLKTALENGVRYGYIQLVRGVGLQGYFRLPVDELPDEEEEQEPGTDEAKEAGTEQQNGDAEGTAEVAEVKAPKPKPKKRKKVAEGGEEGKEGEGEGEGEEGGTKKKKKKKQKRRKPTSYHVSPLKIEDTFALAMTYMCEPKQTSFGKIKKYLTEHYPHVDAENELRSRMEKGEGKGYWERVTGKGVSGTFRLLIDEFDPNSTDNVEDMICSAIIACNEPKQTSANLLKKYVMEYHPVFKIDARPHLFKMALERALKKQMIIQLSGIGASGSFQMWSPFLPSPALLAGEDDEEDEMIFTDKEEVYVPRGTKSRRLVKKAVAEVQKPARPAQKRPRPSSSSSRSKSKVSYAEDAGLDEEEEDPAPKKARKTSKPAKNKKQKKGKKSSAKPKGRKPASRAKLVEEEQEEEEEIEEENEEENEEEIEKPKKSKAEKKEAIKSDRGRARSAPNYAEDDDDEEEPKSRGRKSNSRRSSKTVHYSEKEDDEDDETEYTPRKSKSRGGDGDEVESSPVSSPKKKGKKRR